MTSVSSVVGAGSVYFYSNELASRGSVLFNPVLDLMAQLAIVLIGCNAKSCYQIMHKSALESEMRETSNLVRWKGVR
jgi:hypothetical protein